MEFELYYLIFFCSGERKNHVWVIASSSLYLMLGHMAQLHELRFWTRASLRLLCISFLIYIYIYIYLVFSFIFSYFILADHQREPVTSRTLLTPSCFHCFCWDHLFSQNRLLHLVSHFYSYLLSFFTFILVECENF